MKLASLAPDWLLSHLIDKTLGLLALIGFLVTLDTIIDWLTESRRK